MFLQDACVLGAAGSSGTTSLHALEWFWDDHPAIVKHYGRVVNQSYVDSFVKDMVALEAMLECCPLSEHLQPLER